MWDQIVGIPDSRKNNPLMFDFLDEPSSIIPGMGPEDKVDITSIISDGNATIPGLDLDPLANANDDKPKAKKVPFSKPIPRNFQAQWNETGDICTA